MKIHVKNYRALIGADLELAPLALVAAPNEGGKTSLAHGVASVMLGQAVVLDGVKASEAGSLIHAGAAKAELSIEGPSGVGSIAIPPSRYNTKGERPPRASRYALGLDSLVWLDGKERSRVLLEYLKTAPLKEDLVKALPEVQADVIEKIWAGVEKMGWDAAHQRAVETGQKLKGQWEQITNERFGTQKMLNWTPQQGWSDDLSSASLESLQDELAQAKAFLEAAISASAIGAEERTRLKTLVANEGVLREGLAKQEDEVKRAAAVEARERLAPAAKSVAELKKSLADLRKTLKQAEAVSARKALDTIAMGAKIARERIAKARKDLESRQSVLTDAKKRRTDLGELGDAIELPEGVVGECPHCKKGVMFCNGHFTAAPTADAKKAAADSKARRSKIADADETVRRCEARVAEAERAIGGYEAELKRGEDAEAELASMPKVDCEMSVEEAQRAVGAAESDLKRAEESASQLAALPEVEASQTHAEALRLLGQLQAEFKEVEEAKEKLASLPEVEDARDVNQCRESVRLAEQRLQVWKQKSEADLKAVALKLNLDIVAALATTGVRQQKLVEKFAEFNAALKELCAAAGWKEVVIDADDLKTSYGGWRYSMLSEGAKYRVRAILQVAMARMDGSDLLVLDGADILDAGPAVNGVTRGRPGLIKLLAAVKLPALVLMTTKREEVPDLAKLKVGASYWIENGIVRPLAETAQQAA